MNHNDGDEEDLDWEDVKIAIERFRDDIKEVNFLEEENDDDEEKKVKRSSRRRESA
jgi:hypothetical protein